MANSADRDQLVSEEALIWIYTVCKGRVYPGSAGQGLKVLSNLSQLNSNLISTIFGCKKSLFWSYELALRLKANVGLHVSRVVFVPQTCVFFFRNPRRMNGDPV